MRRILPAGILAALMFVSASWASTGIAGKDKPHDFIPQFHNVIFILDVSDSMMNGYPRSYNMTRLLVATRGLQIFNRVMPHVPHWQYDVNSALITFGDCETPKLASALGPWNRVKYEPMYSTLREKGSGPYRTAGFQEALQLAGSIAAKAAGRTAIVVFTDGGSLGECPQKTAVALKNHFGDRVAVYGVFVGKEEVGWRNIYEVCKLTGGYCRDWPEVRDRDQMKEFAWDVLVREIMFPYPEIFFGYKEAELLPSEAIKLEAVANFLHAIPQYKLQIDGHTGFFGTMSDNYKLAMQRARNVKEALTKMYDVDPRRILIRSWGEELPRYDNQNPEYRNLNRQTNLYLVLSLRNVPYDEKNLHTFGTKAVGDLYNRQERYGDEEWADPVKPPPGARVPIKFAR